MLAAVPDPDPAARGGAGCSSTYRDLAKAAFEHTYKPTLLKRNGFQLWHSKAHPSATDDPFHSWINHIRAFGRDGTDERKLNIN